MDYWTECISTAADECGVVLTESQLECLASAAESGHEFYGQAHGYECIPNPLHGQIDDLKRAHRREMDELEKVTDIYKTAACNLAKVRKEDVYVNNGDAYVQE